MGMSRIRNNQGLITFELLLVLGVVIVLSLCHFQIHETMTQQVNMQMFIAQLRSKLALAQQEAVVTQKDQSVTINMVDFQLVSSVAFDQNIPIDDGIVGDTETIVFSGGNGQVKRFKTLQYETANQRATVALQFGKGVSHVSIVNK